ncbi:MAG: hypothetical protein KY450_04220 [Actinobacteria bacterium]|nr:hypothetical protein [Actinomycetota bacterium]
MVPQRQAGPNWRWWLRTLALPLALVAIGVLLRSSGTPPFGSDNDEYRLVADELLSSGRPVVAGVEATKYPLGYPVVLAAFDLVGLPVTSSAIALNIVLVGALAVAVAVLARAAGPRVAAVPAAVYAVASPGLWGSVFVTMPDLAFVVVSALVVWRAGVLVRRGDVGVLAGLVGLATVLKSMGLLVALAAGVAVLFGPRALRRLAWVPVASGLALTAVMAALVAPYPQHTTGYARTFLLVDPTDDTLGRVSLIDVVARVGSRAWLVLRDVGFAVVGPDVPTPWSWLVALALVGAGAWALWANPPRRAYVVAFVAIWLPALAVWPYSSVRFQLPLVPIAAVGVGGLAVAAVRRGGGVAAVAVVAALAAFLVGSGAQLRRQAEVEAATVGAVAADTAATAAWARSAIPEGDVVASFAYREVAYHLDRPVVPLGYTGDMERLWAEASAAGARWLVVMPSLYGARGALEDRFVTTFADRLRLVHDTATVDTYAVTRS